VKVAINGCGVAGPALAWWLRRYGHEPVLFELAPALRTGGYLVDFWGTGYDVAEKMGLLPGLQQDGYIMQHLRTVTARGRTTSSVNVETFRELTGGRYLSIARSALSRRTFEACDGVEARFGTHVVGLEDRADKVAVRLSDGSEEDFDLLIGADGLHSEVRALAFGPQADFERHLGFHVAACVLPGYRPRDELTYVSHTLPGRQMSRVALRDDRTLFLFVFATRLLGGRPEGTAAQKTALRRVYDDMRWEAPAILARLDEVEDLYFDRVSQIRMPDWCRGRVALLGDAAACVSLLAGEGTGLALAEAYVLAGELHRAAGDHGAAFAAYQRRLQAHLAKKQAAALKFAGFFAPRNWLTLVGRDVLMNLISIPFLARPLLRGSFTADFDLPAYDGAA
jgi:2-polyprenyl-6-methoxyphenol hydroxylase-like FAD-dependent oxidoreductase